MKQRISAKTSVILTVLTAFFLMLALTSVTSAEVTELNVTPEVVLQGETLSVSGKASPGEEVWLNSSFEISIPVSEGEYLGEFNGINIPKGEKKFSVTAENIKNIRLSIYPVFWRTIEYPLQGPLNATNGTATITVSFPADYYGITIDIYGEKDIKVYGDAVEDATSVNLKTEMSIKVTADADGDFKLDVSTKGVPSGEFLISAGEIEKTVRIFKNGDVNADEVVDSYDCVYIARWIAGIPGYDLEEKVAEVSGDEIVDAYDCVYLARHIAGIPGYEELE